MTSAMTLTTVTLLLGRQHSDDAGRMKGMLNRVNVTPRVGHFLSNSGSLEMLHLQFVVVYMMCSHVFLQITFFFCFYNNQEFA